MLWHSWPGRRDKVTFVRQQQRAAPSVLRFSVSLERPAAERGLEPAAGRPGAAAAAGLGSSRSAWPPPETPLLQGKGLQRPGLMGGGA